MKNTDIVVVVAFLALMSLLIFLIEKVPVPAYDQTRPAPTLVVLKNTAFGYAYEYDSSSYTIITPQDGPFGDVVFTQSVFNTKQYDAYNQSSTSEETPPSLTITVFRNPQNLDVDLWIKNSSYSNFKLSTNKQLSDIQMGSTTYKTYQWDGLYRGDEYVYAQDGYIYVFSNTWLNAQNRTKAAMELLIRSVIWSTPTELAQTAHGDIVLTSPKVQEAITSPVTITGTARGSWYFEASFPVVLVDWDGQIIAHAVAQAQGDWMTTNMVPFTATLTFTKPKNNPQGSIILKKDNPSGLPQNDDAIEVPILFK